MKTDTPSDKNICEAIGLSECPKPMDDTLPDPKKMLQWSPQERLIGFRNDYRNHPGDVFKHGEPYPLPKSCVSLEDISYPLGGQTYPFSDYRQKQNVVGMLVIKEGTIVYEYYDQGNTGTTLWTSRSVGKSVVSILVGIAINEGKIQSLQDKLTDYKPELINTAWEEVTLEQLIQHTSGVVWNEDYTDPQSDFSKLTEYETQENAYQLISDLVHNLKRKEGVQPGEVFSYNTGGAWLLGDILEIATGVPLAKYLEEKIWLPFGMAHDGVWQAYIPGKHDMGGHGFNATLEDWGRFGLFVLRNGKLKDGTQILPDNWVTASRAWNDAKGSANSQYPEGTFGYQWRNHSIPEHLEEDYPTLNPISEDTMWALGIYGQMMAINQKENLIMVQWSLWDEAEPSKDSTLMLEATLLFSSIAKKLRNQND